MAIANGVILIRPLINEKSMALVKDNFYTFEVSKEANKDQIARMVIGKFSVTPLDIKTVNLPAKLKRQRRGRGYYQQKAMKKAIVKIKPGQKIPLFEVASEEQEEVTVTTAEGEVKAKVKEKKSLLRGTKVKIEKEKKEAAS